jgi:hypothetical protein
MVNILMGFVRSVSGFVPFRFMLGIGEGLNWPGASMTVVVLRGGATSRADGDSKL